MTDVEKETITNILQTTNPSLYLGAGFSYGSLNEGGRKIPLGDEVKSCLLEKYIGNPDLHSALKNKYLLDVCEFVKEENEKEYINLLTTLFSGYQPQEYHYYLSDYSWNNIFTVNIDDIVEKIYIKSNKPIQVFNSQKNEMHSNYTDQKLFKLHGCITKPERGFVFSKSEYENFIDDTTDYRLSVLKCAFQENTFFIIGTELNEYDLDYFANLYKKAENPLFTKEIVFINPSPSPIFEQKLKRHPKWTVIRITTEDFLKFIHDQKRYLKNTVNEQNQLQKRYALFSRELLCKDLVNENAYKSKLYFGFSPLWEDIYFSYFVPYSDIQIIYDKVKQCEQRIFVILGRAYSGKTTLLKALFMQLSNIPSSYCLYCDSEEISIGKIQRVTDNIKENNIYLFWDNGADYYSLFDRVLQIDSRIKIVSTSTFFIHNRKRYVLDHDTVFEYSLREKLYNGDIKLIQDTVTAKGLAGKLTGKPLEEWGKSISLENSIVNAMYKITEHLQFKEYYKSTNFNKLNSYKIILIAAVFNKLEIPYVHQILFSRSGSKLNKNTLDEAHDYIQVFEHRAIKIISPYVADAILERANKEDLIQIVVDITFIIAGFITEKEKNYWKIVYEYLSKYKFLKSKLKFTNDDIEYIFQKQLLLYKDISYYWLQLGMLEQSMSEFDYARTHFDNSLAIHPNSYQLLHAKARNYCKQAVFIEEYTKGQYYFEEGEKLFMKLIETSEYKQSKSYSIHSLIYEKMHFCKYYNINLDEQEKKRFGSLLRDAARIDSNDSIMTKLQKDFFLFINEDSKFSSTAYKEYEESLDT